MPLSDMTYAVISKVHARSSARRLAGRLLDDAERGYTESTASFNTVLRYMRNPEMTPILLDLVEVSSRPLAAIESQFAVDSTGFGTVNTRTWFSHKHGREMSERDWRKLHACCGTATHVITAATVTESTSNDAPHLPSLVATTAQNFPGMAEVSADKGYLTKSNADAVEKHGATPLIPFKSNSVEPPEGTAWARMYHLFAYNRAEFLARYHQRSNVETVFHMIKTRFGDELLSKTSEGQTNEVLAKVVAHNLCVLIAAFHELGIEPNFAPSPTAAAVAG
jgi:transposase